MQKYPVELTFEKYLNARMITQNEIDIIKNYISYKKATAKHLSERRAYMIMVILTYWRKYIKTPYTSANIDEIIVAVGELKTAKNEKGRAYAKNTITQYIAVLKTFLCYLSDKELTQLSEKRIKKDIVAPGMDKHTTAPENILTPDDIKKMLTVTFNPMHRALIVVSFESGARPEEINALQWSDLTADEYGYKLNIWDFKNDTRKSARLTISAPYIGEWQKATLKNAPTDYIFVDRYIKPLSYQSTFEIVQRIAKKAGITKGVTLYSLRKGRINNMVQTNMPNAVIKSQIWNNQGSQMLDTYLALDGRAIDEMTLNHLGIKKDTKVIVDPMTPRTCPECHTINEYDARFCKKCTTPLTMESINARAEAIQKATLTPEYTEVDARIKALEDMILKLTSAKA